ncbi:hypothetical protein VTN96DRAFT_6821 [Rasamsonia emersonii]
MDQQSQPAGYPYSNQEGWTYPPTHNDPYEESDQQAAPRTVQEDSPAPSPPLRDPWGYRKPPDARDPRSYQRIPDAQDLSYHSRQHPHPHYHHHGLETFGDPTGQYAANTSQYLPDQQSFPHANHPQFYSPTGASPPQHHYTLDAPQSQYPRGDPLEYGHANRRLLPRASYGTIARRQVRQDNYGNCAQFANPPSPNTAEEADSLARDLDHLTLPSDDPTRAERQLHRRYDLAKVHETGMETSLDPGFQVKKESYFEFGKVFAVLHHQNAGAQVDHRDSDTFTSGRYGEKIYSSIRPMVVVKNFRRHSLCIAIWTYSGNGVAKKSVDPSSHAVVYNADSKPYTHPKEPRMTKEPLAVKVSSPDLKLDQMSRINFNKIYTVEHNEKVLPIGKIARESLPKLKEYSRDVISHD